MLASPGSVLGIPSLSLRRLPSPSTLTSLPAALLHPRMPPQLRKLCHRTKLFWHWTKRRWCTKDRQFAKNISVASWSPSDRKSATTTSWNSEGPTGFTPTARTRVNFIQCCCKLFSPSITSRIRSRFPVGTFPTCVHIATESCCQTIFGGTS